MTLVERILYEDNHMIAINKLPGELSQGDQTGDPALGDVVKQYLKEKYNKPGNVFLGVVHRLDRPVSGVILFARTTKALERLTKMWRERKIKKTYWALVEQGLQHEQGRLTHFLKRLPGKNITRAYDKPVEDSKEAILDYKCLKRINSMKLLEIQPFTGRQHQIRVQLAKISCPVVGDVKYGYPNPNPDASICLHARELELIHPVQQIPVTLLASPPANSRWSIF